MSKSQLAECAGVSVRTLMNWCEPFRQELTMMGMSPNAKVLPPHIVKFICEKFDIEVWRKLYYSAKSDALCCNKKTRVAICRTFALVLEHRRKRVHLHPPRAHACTFPGTTRAGYGGEKIENSKCLTKTAIPLLAVPSHLGEG